MAFIASTPLVSRSKAPLSSNNCTQFRVFDSLPTTTQPQIPRATAVQPSRPIRPRTSAPVVDSRVASRHEAHHWVTVRNDSRRIFERAAVAQADLVRQFESDQPTKALHRWVLRESSSSLSSHNTNNTNTSRYLVTESYDNDIWIDQNAMHTRRWLAAVERVGPLISTVDVHSRHYSDVFTSKLHDLKFDPWSNIVVLTCLNLVQNASSRDAVVTALKAKAERSVAIGDCLEVSILKSDQHGYLYKTLEIFENKDALIKYLDGLDKVFARNIQPHTVDARPTRHVFTPVVFS